VATSGDTTPCRVTPFMTLHGVVSPDNWRCKWMRATTSERGGNELKSFKDFDLKSRARIRPWLSKVCHVRSTAVQGYLAHKKTPTPLELP